MSGANIRIQWLHRKLSTNSYPNAQRLAERFGISHRQAQRDFDYLKDRLGAPLEYDSSRKGFHYTAPFTLPVFLTSDNDELYAGFSAETSIGRADDVGQSIIQMQIPYTATVEIPDKLTAMEISGYIVERIARNRYVCEFHSVERFFGQLFAMNADFRIVEPEWVREKVAAAARRILKNNGDV